VRVSGLPCFFFFLKPPSPASLYLRSVSFNRLVISAHRYLDLSIAYDFLDTKRTNMRIVSLDTKVGHNPCEDYPDVAAKKMLAFLDGTLDLNNFKTVRVPKRSEGLTD
jgi:hypothetical protein